MSSCSKKMYQGSTLVTALLFFYLFGFLFLLLVEDYRLTSTYSRNTQNFYVAKTLTSLFLTERNQSQESLSQGKVNYSQGTLTYKAEAEVLKIVVTVEDQEYRFEQRL